MRNLIRKHILKVNPYIPGKPIEEVERTLGLRGVIKLASNENTLPPSPRVILAARRSLRFVNRYPDGNSFYLKKALARRFGVKPANIVVGNGSDEIIILALRAFLHEGEEVIIAKQTFLIYEVASEIAGAKIKYAPLRDFRYDVRKIASLITKKTKFIFIANPDNPTGTYITKEEVDFLVSRTPKDTILFFDEAYFEFAKDLEDFPRTFKYLKKKNIIITRSFSKAYSLAGLRAGYAFAKDGIIECLNRVREPFNVNSIAQAAGLAALDDNSHVERTLRLVRAGKDYLYKEFGLLGLRYVPSVTNFILADVGRDSKEIFNKLLRRGVIVREMSPWKFNNFIRVTIGTMAENRRFIAALKEVL